MSSIDLESRHCYPVVRLVQCEDGDVIISLDNYPVYSTMAMPISSAVELATQILCLANKQIKEAA